MPQTPQPVRREESEQMVFAEKRTTILQLASTDAWVQGMQLPHQSQAVKVGS